MTVAVEFSRPVVAGVIGNFILQMVKKWEVVGRVVGQYTLVVGEKYQVAVKVVVEFSGPMVGKWWGRSLINLLMWWVTNGKWL